ncbi:receptor-like protein kinase FERONIA [Malania oleifera]|uniref:receptor-like protein kinase FERONIA n=1 Tax=Malania oleifera TaxID=397392 RepID=UPI0025AE0A7D|nr:receptor-like protein kinase FERONIA [Malania oleifera]
MNNLLPIHLLCLLFLSIHFKTSIAYTPPESIAINCGSPAGTAAQDGRTWAGDNSSELLSSEDLKSSSTSKASTQDYAPQIPYMTARVSQSKFTYTFPVAGGPKFIRLHFHPASYSSTNASNSFFSVTANIHYTLLHNFSAFLTSRFLKQTYFYKEFCLNVEPESGLSISFTPSPGSFAFVNGIEVVSMPSNLYMQSREIPIVGQSQEFPLDNVTALEMVYRLNVDGQFISPVEDTGMFRSWSEDDDYIIGTTMGGDPYHMEVDIEYTVVPNYTAPTILYRTARSMGMNPDVNRNYNLTWSFPIDSGFNHLVRLHFCEIAPEITTINERVFQIFLNNQTAEDEMDIMVYAQATGVPIYKEYIVMVPELGKQGLWLALHPNSRTRPKYSDALLNGLEIFKLNKSDGSLAGPNPEPILDRNPRQIEPSLPMPEHPKKIRMALTIGAAVLGGAIVLYVLLYAIFRRRTALTSKISKSSEGTSWWWCPFSPAASELTKSQHLPSGLCRHFSLAEIKSATDNFSDALVIGIGGFGKVYRGQIDGGATTVAIKRLSASSRQGAHEFRTEIEMLSQLRHLHLVSLIGYCADHQEMILVYDYMAHGTLRDHLYNTTNPPLPWTQRLKICIGAARGLHYLHTGAKHTIIHRDVKTTNILLDDKWVAKVSDFGLSRLGPTDVSRTHVSTEVKGSFGYLDPEYYRRQQLTTKSDVYSFGVVLYEVLCAKPPLDKSLARNEMCLSEWARSYHKSGRLDQIVDPCLRDRIAPECLKKFEEIAYRCLLDQGIERPTMGDVVWNLEFALQLQESEEEGSGYKGGTDSEDSQFSACFVSGSTNGTVDGVSGSTGYSAMGLSGSVFSEIITPKGR